MYFYHIPAAQHPTIEEMRQVAQELIDRHTETDEREVLIIVNETGILVPPLEKVASLDVCKELGVTRRYTGPGKDPDAP